jgi:site-specific DNA-cytosine methylase
MLVVGSDCSGLCTESHALDALGIAHTHAFCSEVWEPAIRAIRAMDRRPKVMYRDVTEREVESVPEVDLYVCGFPCQPNSAMNLKRGEVDARRDPMAKALEYIRVKRPKYWVLENVTRLVHVSKGAVWRALVDTLDALEGYAWDYRVLCPSKHANSPQSRPCVYLVGKRGADRIEWPTEVPLKTRCVDLLDPRVADGQPAALCYLRMLETWGIAPDAPGLVEFCAASRAYSPYKANARALQPNERKNVLRADVAPCLIKHDPGLYANHLRRHLTADECLALQGFDPAKVRRPQVTPLQMRQLCGNAMHCGVLAEVFALLLDETE